MKRYTSLTKMIIAAVLAVLAIIVPFVVVRIVFALAAAVIFALSLKKFTALLITLTVIFILIPVIGFWGTHLYLEENGNYNLDRQMQQWLGGFFNSRTGDYDYDYEYRYNYDYNYQTGRGFEGANLIKPDESIDSETYLEIEGGGFKIEFDKSTDKISLPESMNVDRSGNSLTLSSPKGIHNYNAKIIIGTKNSYKRIKINCGAAEIDGDIETDFLVIKTAAIDLGGTYRGKTLDLTSEAAGIDIEVEGTEEVLIKGTAMAGNIKYLDVWKESRKMIVDCIVGSMKVLTPYANDGKLNIERNTAVFKLVRAEY